MVYEDFQCPYCARFERVHGPELTNTGCCRKHIKAL
ncbi:hypothetical protein [Mycobacterium uberis]